MSTTPSYQDPPAIDPIGGVLALLLPGAGHWFQGERRRGVLVGIGILGLFFSGLLIGGVDVVDSRHDRLWFLGQALVGPVALGTDYIHQHRLKGYDPSTNELRSPGPNEVRDPSTGQLVPGAPGSQPPLSKSLGKMNEIGMLYCTIAGMLNLIVVIDAAFPSRRRSGRRA
ncbi:MAG TPA: DUF6677 family protein [Phycisphaerales bacterium]|nr:DUF6677 family protein [Phycisphaerales bacterium]